MAGSSLQQQIASMRQSFFDEVFHFFSSLLKKNCSCFHFIFNTPLPYAVIFCMVIYTTVLVPFMKIIWICKPPLLFPPRRLLLKSLWGNVLLKIEHMSSKIKLIMHLTSYHENRSSVMSIYIFLSFFFGGGWGRGVGGCVKILYYAFSHFI